jgi:hypothetical protein
MGLEQGFVQGNLIWGQDRQALSDPVQPPFRLVSGKLDLGH